MGRHCGCRGKCHCRKPREIVYPTREEVRNVRSEETIRHIQPIHTRVINHHTIRNEYYYPHTTSYEERVNRVDVRGARDRGPGTSVVGARSPFNGGYGRGDRYGRGDGYVRGRYGRGGGCGCGCGGRGRCGRRRGGFFY